jgi:hypothetical protein
VSSHVHGLLLVGFVADVEDVEDLVDIEKVNLSSAISVLYLAVDP